MDDENNRKPSASAPTCVSDSAYESGQNSAYESGQNSAYESGQNSAYESGQAQEGSGSDHAAAEITSASKSAVIEKERALTLDSGSKDHPRLMTLQDSAEKENKLHEDEQRMAAAAANDKKRSAKEAEVIEDDSGNEADTCNGEEIKDELSAKREYNRVSAAKSRAKRKKTLTGLNEMVEEESRKYNQLYDQNKRMREKVGSLFQETLSGLLGTCDRKDSPDSGSGDS